MNRSRELKKWLAALGISGLAMPISVDSAVATDPPKIPLPKAGIEGLRTPGLLTLQANQGRYVVINHEEQYSIWPQGLERPRGWKPLGDDRPLGEAVEGIAARVDRLRFRVVINHEEQYSIWPVDRELPRGFRTRVEKCGLSECARHLAELAGK